MLAPDWVLSRVSPTCLCVWQWQGAGSAFAWLAAHTNCPGECCEEGLTAEHPQGRTPTFRLCGKKAPMMPGARASRWQVHEKWMKDEIGFFFLQMPSECGNCSAGSALWERGSIVRQEPVLPGELATGSPEEPNSPAAFTSSQASEISAI